MYGFIRIFIAVIVFISILLLTNRYARPLKISRIIALALSLILMIALYFVPFENLFIKFDSPEEVYEYVNNGDIKAIIDGNNTSLIAADRNGKNKYYIAPRDTNKGSGWKISTAVDTGIDIGISEKDFNAIIIQYKNDKEYYLAVYNNKDESINISDSLGTKFMYDGKNGYYAFFEEIDSNYTLIVDGRSYSLTVE